LADLAREFAREELRSSPFIKRKVSPSASEKDKNAVDAGELLRRASASEAASGATPLPPETDVPPPFGAALADRERRERVIPF